MKNIFDEYFLVKEFKCPKCESENIDYFPDSIVIIKDFGEIKLGFFCADCGVEWISFFEFQGFGCNNENKH